jgi:hypothetical protein
VDDDRPRWFLVAGTAVLALSGVMIVAFGGLVSGFGLTLARGESG